MYAPFEPRREGRLRSRRALLWQVGGVALGAATVSLLASCSPAAPSSTSSDAGGAAPTTGALAAATAPVAAAAPTSVPAATSSGATPTGTLRYASADFSNESMDPINIFSYWGLALYDTLLTIDRQGNVVPNVAESYSLSPDGLTWTFNIRKDITFHNGDPLTAADVAFSLQRFASKDSTNPWTPYLLKNQESITATDDYTVVYRAQRPEWLLKIPFASTPTLPQKYFASVGQAGFRNKPVGSGPYKFVAWVPRTSIEFEANASYWGPKPQWAHIVETLVPEEATRVAQLKRGDVDMIGALSIDRLVELKNGGFRLQEVGLPWVSNIVLPGTWMTQGPTSDIRVRQAMSYAIDRQELCNTFYRGLAKPGGWWFWSSQSWGYDPSQWQADPFDPDKALQLLQAAGYPSNFTRQTIPLYTTAPNADLLQTLQGYWQKVGLATEIQVVDSTVWLNMSYVRAQSPADKQVGSAILNVTPSSFNNVYQSGHLFTSTGARTTGNDPKADQMYQAVLDELDEAKSKQLWQQMMHYGYDTMWVNLELVEVPALYVVGPRVGAFTYKQHMLLQEAYVGIQLAT